MLPLAVSAYFPADVKIKPSSPSLISTPTASVVPYSLPTKVVTSFAAAIISPLSCLAKKNSPLTAANPATSISALP